MKNRYDNGRTNNESSNGYKVERIPDLPNGVTSGVRITLPAGVSPHDIDMNSIVAMLGATVPYPGTPYPTEEDVDNFEINKVIAENDKYIAPAILDAKPDTADLESDLEKNYKRLRFNNAIVAENLAAEMANLYRRHIATILEYTTQNLITGAQDTRDQLYHLISNIDD